MTTSRRGSAPRPAAAPQQKRFPIVPVVFGVIAVVLIAVVLLSFNGESVPDEYGSPNLTGEPLPRFDTVNNDGAIGLAAPEVVGADFDSTPVSITNDGRPKMIMFVAHWCPHCQAEVPVVEAWIDDGGLPPEVDLYTVATSIQPNRTNYPTSKWLERETWSSPVVVDDASSSVGGAFGLSAFPYWVLVDGNGLVTFRVTGEIGTDAINTLAQDLASG